MPRSSLSKLAILLVSTLLIQGCGDPIQSNRGELCKFVPNREALDANSQVEGRVAVVYKGALYDPKFDHGCMLDGYSGGRVTPFYFPEEMYARSLEELDTLIMIELSKGEFIKTARYNRTQSFGTTADVYSGRLSISMIDYKNSTLVRNSVIVLTKVPDKIKSDQLKHTNNSSANSEYVIEPNIGEIQAALREFSAKVTVD